ncbi:MAG TPA: cupredoxin domain-containing protein [Methanocella sp.]|nr:cupredoxin domain-containing protein [Methanocella sp.]
MDCSKILVIGLAIIATALVAGCSTGNNMGANTTTPSPTGTPITASPEATITAQAGPAPSQVDVTIKDSSFSPDTVTVTVHGTVTWTNKDTVAHTVDFNGDHSKQLVNGDTFAKTFDTPGTYEYTCGIHPFMKGKVIVQ